MLIFRLTSSVRLWTYELQVLLAVVAFSLTVHNSDAPNRERKELGLVAGPAAGSPQQKAFGIHLGDGEFDDDGERGWCVVYGTVAIPPDGFLWQDDLFEKETSMVSTI